jgi:dipeptidase D
MEYKITGYRPEKLFHFFEDISAIPRSSGNEKAISDYLVKFAVDRGLQVHQDRAFNIIIKKPGSKGAESLPAIMLQGHLDMVCEKVSGCNHNFECDGLDLYVQDGMLRARGTTLGGDNGIAVALMMAVLDDKSLIHPPIECVFTTEEEVGLNGAASLDKSNLEAKTMINLDSEEEGVATVSCAGGMRCALTRKAKRERVDGCVVAVSVSGLLGGHSGTDIDKGRYNANKVMGRILNRVMSEFGGRIVSFTGGSKDNAIPRECSAAIICPDAEKLLIAVRDFANVLALEIQPSEPDFLCEVSSYEQKDVSALSVEDSQALVRTICLGPDGIRRRDTKKSDFIVASINLGVVRTADDSINLVFSPRSSVASIQEETVDILKVLADTFGYKMDISGQYPGWSFCENSPVRDVFIESYRELFGNELRIEAIHAGLECGLFSGAIPDLDAIAVGPTILGCHTPDERLPLDSVERFYKLLTSVLEKLTR